MTQPPTTALITGAAGFCGRHLATDLVTSGYQVAGLDLLAASIPGVACYAADLADGERLRAVLAEVQPATVFHLAALTDPRLPYAELHRVNALGTLSLLEAVRATCPTALVLVTITSAVYGAVPPDEQPIGENQPFHPASAYAVSKVAQEMIAYQQATQHGLRLIRARTFNLTGPGESPAFVTSAFARQIADIEAGRCEPELHTGNLQTVRDFVDVRDAVRAYRLLAERGRPGDVYNICSEQGTPIHELLRILLGLSRVRPISVVPDPARLQPADVPLQVGSAARLRAATGWVPTISLPHTLQAVLDDWRARRQGSREQDSITLLPQRERGEDKGEE